MIRSLWKWVRSLFRPGQKENWTIIVFCIVMATVFWFFNALNKNYDAQINYPVSFNIPNDSTIIVTKPLPQQMRLSVSGGGWTLLRKTFWFNIQPIEITINSPEDDYISGNTLTPAIQEVIADLRLREVLTDSLQIHIEKKVAKKLRVNLDSLGVSLAENHLITSPIYKSTDSVEIIGPESIISNWQENFLISINENNIDNDFSGLIDLRKYESSLTNIKPNKISVRFEVDQFEKTTRNFTVRTKNFPANKNLQDSTIAVQFSAPKEYLKNADSIPISIIANYRKRNKQDSTVIPEVEAFGQPLMNVQPDSTKIKIIDIK